MLYVFNIVQVEDSLKFNFLKCDIANKSLNSFYKKTKNQFVSLCFIYIYSNEREYTLTYLYVYASTAFSFTSE